MILIIAWLIAMGTSELLLWPYHYLHIFSPLAYIALCLIFLYQRNKIRNNRDLSSNEKKIKTLRSGILFLVTMLIMLALSVNIHFLINLSGSLCSRMA
ncbi:hypothetical protein EDF73_102579 [Raoultella sp. BIGb0138]|uniref:hypothetical protein n=1 Tax=Raoultella sp. BIGb0138 TaxID=2485115 RepID=UPI0010467FED|nr:hypothetical protein [Raoultella sp. BIGb0138]TCW16768.1 hypothetical protein EDF73_102579 [Raoultella sp. BIGb0138]